MLDKKKEGTKCPEPRLNQILLPLLSVVSDQHLRIELRSMALEAQLSLVAEWGLLVEAQVLEILAELMAGSERPVVPVAGIVSIFIERYGFEYERPITNCWIGSILRKRLNIGTYKSSWGLCRTHGRPIQDRAALCALRGKRNRGRAAGGIMGDMGMWGLSSYSPRPAPELITSKPLPLITVRLDPRGNSPRPLVPIVEPGKSLHPPEAAWPSAIQIFANLAILHPSRWRRISHIMARVSQHFVFGERTP